MSRVNQINQGFLEQAARVALKSKCQRAKTGAVLVKKGRILIKAYNQIFPANDFCEENGCLRDKLKLGLGKEAEKCRSIHTEARAVGLGAKKGISLQGSTAYVTCQPCINCAKLLYTAGVREVYFLDRHADQTGKRFLEKMGVSCQQVRLSGAKPEKRLRDLMGQK